MAINFNEISSYYENDSSLSNVPPTGNVFNFNKDNVKDSVDSSISKRKNKKPTNKSPYLCADNVQMISQVTEKKIINRKHGLFSSFSLAADIYKTNSDNCKPIKKKNKKVKKSVLTLPNNPLPLPQVCTLSDFYDDDIKNDKYALKSHIKQYPNKSKNKKLKKRLRDNEFYDRDGKYCSKMNGNFQNCSSTDTIKYKGDGTNDNLHVLHSLESEEEFKPHDVWAMLRNMNRFQFRPSPRISDEESIMVPRKKKLKRQRRNNKNDTRIIETLRTEEFAFISNINVDSTKTPSLSQTSSFDRITVIEQDTTKEVCQSRRDSNHKRNCKYDRSNKIVTKAFTNSQSTFPKDYTDHTLMGHKEILNPEDYNEGLGESNFISLEQKERSLCNENTNFNITNKSSSSILQHPPQKQQQKTSSIYSGNSGSSKAHNNTKDAEQKIQSISKNRSSKPAVSLASLKNIDRKPRIVTIEPSSITPKLTQAEIKRRLAHIKFPLIIMGKDQVRTEMKAFQYEYSQFEGLDKRIWPFMSQWMNHNINKTRKDDLSKSFPKENKNEVKTDNKVNHSANSKKLCNEIVVKDTVHKTKYSRKINEDALSSEIKAVRKKPSTTQTRYGEHPMMKSKPIKTFKDKMVKLIYKNSSTTTLDNNAKMVCQGDSKANVKAKKILEGVKKIHLNKKLINVGTETNVKFNMISNDLSVRNPSPNSRENTSVCLKHPWAKAKWASDFIDAVIGKLKNGVYYIYENRKQKVKDITDTREVAIQTTLTMKSLCQYKYNKSNERYESTSKIKMIKIDKDPFRFIPGFDDTLPCLEINTNSVNQISVKHCTANVIVQFDVSIPVEANEFFGVRKSSSFVPICSTNSYTQIFKCKTTLINGMLPAELCSILPEMMRNIIQTNIASSENTLAKQTEIITPEALHIPITQELRNPQYQTINSKMSLVLKNILMNGYLGNAYYVLKETNSNNALNTRLNLKYDQRIYSILPTNPSSSMKYCISSINKYLPFPELSTLRSVQNDRTHDKNSCAAKKTVFKNVNAIEKCAKSNLSILPAYNRLNIIETLESILAVRNNSYSYYTVPNLLQKLEKSNNTIYINICYKSLDLIPATIEQKMAVYFDYNPLKTFYENDESNKIFCEKTNLALATNAIYKSMDVCTKNHEKSIKTRKGLLVRLNKKCKSTSNISNARSFTPITKIVNLEDFFQALGTSKSLWTVMDGYPGEKIMKSILEMKNWIMELSPKQAFLVLLLTNKKDTPNLVRFRPILLQGIAVNRITRASELDMEIEVIERENFRKFPQFEGVDCFSALTENRDNLSEELFWIAKTTASDYQRPFDESSEKLLKSLLEKRKKLNPSYLRVMARYVGLGLLKTSNNS